MKLWVSSGVFVAAGAPLSKVLLPPGPGLGWLRQTRCCCYLQATWGPLVSDFSLNLKLTSTLEVRLAFSPGSRLSQAPAGARLEDTKARK